jgi:predicted ATPase
VTIQRIHIRGFKCIRDQNVELRPINVLIGPNGAGKSNFVNLFRMFNRMVERDFQVFVRQTGGAEKLLYFGSKVTSEISVSIEFPPNQYSCTLAPDVGGSLFFKHESWWAGRHSQPGAIKTSGKMEFLPSPAHESGLVDSGQQVARETRAHMKEWKVYHFHDTSDWAKVKTNCRIADNLDLRPDASNLAAILYLQKRSFSDTYSAILEAVQRAAPFLQNFVLEPERDNEETIRLRWKHVGTDAYFDVSDLSDGTLRFICLCTLFMQPKLPSTILLDEPELGLHPHAIHLLAGIMQKASSKAQIIAATQSVTLANQFSFQDVIVVDREAEESVFRRHEAEEYKAWSEEYGLGDLWEKNVLGGTP